MKRDKYTKTLAKNQVFEIFQMRDIGKKGLPKFIKLCMETPCCCPCQEVSKKFFRASVWSKNKGGGGGGGAVFRHCIKVSVSGFTDFVWTEGRFA